MRPLAISTALGGPGPLSLVLTRSLDEDHLEQLDRQVEVNSVIRLNTFALTTSQL